MVARNRLTLLKPMGAEIARNDVAGLSRIPAEFLTSNCKAGLYAYKLKMRRIGNARSLQEMEKHFAKERMMRNAERRNFQRLKAQKMKRNFCERERSHRGHGGYQSRACDVMSQHVHTKVCPPVLTGKARVASIPRQRREGHNKTLKPTRVPNRSERIHTRRASQAKTFLNKKCGASPSTNFDAAEISIMALRQKFRNESRAFAIDALSNSSYDIDQQKRKLKVLNAIIHSSRENMNDMSKSRAVLISNLAWAEKEQVRANSRRLFIRRNLAIQQLVKSLRRVSKRSLRIGHKNRKGCNLERAMSTEVLDAELEAGEEAPFFSDPTSTIPSETMSDRWTRFLGSGAPSIQPNPSNHITFDHSTDSERTSQTRNENVERSNIFNSSRTGGEHPGELTAILEDLEDEEIPPAPEVNQNESTPQVNNSKSLFSTNINFPSFESISIEKSTSDGDWSNEPFVLNPNLDPRDYISLSPDEETLRIDGLLPDFSHFKNITLFFNPFMNEIAKCLEAAQHPNYDLKRMAELCSFSTEIALRTQSTYPLLNKKYCEDIIASCAEMFELAMESQSEANFLTKTVQSTPWKIFTKELSKSRASARRHTSSAPQNAPDDGGDDDSSSSDDEDKPKRNKILNPKKMKKSNAKKKFRIAFNDSSTDDSEDDDKEYRSIITTLNKNSKYYKIKELQMHSDPTTRREKFNTWVIDLKNILSTHKKTAKVLNGYPSHLQKIDSTVDRALKAILSSVTSGMAKKIVSRASSAFEALEDLRRNCAQASRLDLDRERLKMMLMRQSHNEKASEFIRRIQKQIEICEGVGCNEYTRSAGQPNSPNVVSITLQGLNEGNRIYAATIADLKSKFRDNPSSITFTMLESIFFQIDDENSAFQKRREQANYIHGGQSEPSKKFDASKIKCFLCGKIGHLKRDCSLLSRPKSAPARDISQVTCHKCGKKGHYANKCPQQQANKASSSKEKKKITFESAHVASGTPEEHCNMALETRKVFLSSLRDFIEWLLDSGATSHFTPFLKDLINATKLSTPLNIKVANGTTLKATHVGEVIINFISDQGVEVDLRLLRVLYVPGLQTRLFSIESFTSDGKTSAVYSNGTVKLSFGEGVSLTIELPHLPPASFSCHNDHHLIEPVVSEIANEAEQQSPPPMCGNNSSSPAISTSELSNRQDTEIKKKRMDVNLGHRIFGHRSISALLKASESNVWEDITMVEMGDSWCDQCHIAKISKNHRSKTQMEIKGKPLEHIFIDLVPIPATLRGIPECRDKNFLFLCDPLSKFVDKVNVENKSAEETIRVLTNWRQTMKNYGFTTFLYLRSDAGSNFTSDAFKKWCEEQDISLSIAGPKHQEQNGFVEAAYRITNEMARSMLVQAHLPLSFLHLALDYACLILRVLPTKNLLKDEKTPTTTYELLYNKRPRVQRFKVFGCPVVFKRYQPVFEGDASTKFTQLQRGSRGIFVGFPKNQAGWLIYVPEKIANKHLVVCVDVVFDQHMLSNIAGTNFPFAQSQPEIEIGRVGGPSKVINEATGDLTNLADHEISHWGEATPETTPQPCDSDALHGKRRSARLRKLENAFLSCSNDFSIVTAEQILDTLDEVESVFSVLVAAAQENDIPLDPYLPEPKSLADIRSLPPNLQRDWLATSKKELKFIIENGTLDGGEEEIQVGDEVIPCILIYKAKITSRGFLDKLKARCVARGDLQIKSSDPDYLWSPCVFSRTFKTFVAQAVKRNRPIKQLDYIGAFCQALMRTRLFLQLPKEYAFLLPEYSKYFEGPRLLLKSLYGTDIAAKSWNQDLTEWMTTNEVVPFKQSEVDPSLFVHRSNEGYIFMAIYVDDSIYFGSDDELECKFTDALSKRFKLELQGWSHYFLGTRLYRDVDGSYTLDQENYIHHVLKRYCGKDTSWGLPPFQSTPAPTDYIYSKDNRPKSEEEKTLIAAKYPNLSMPSAVSSLLYAALNTRSDILWATNKLAKSANNPGLKDFAALMHLFGYLRKYPDYAIKFYRDVSQSPANQICLKHQIPATELLAFSDTSWQDCPDTGRSTSGFKIFLQGGIIDAQSTMPVPVALSSAEAEYMGACNAGAMLCHIRDLIYDFEFLGTDKYDVEESTKSIPAIILVDNQATIRMSKNYKITSKNRHIARRWHFVRRGVQDKLFTLHWVSADDQLADDLTKTQPAAQSFPHFNRTLIKIPDKVKGFRSNTIGNR